MGFLDLSLFEILVPMYSNDGTKFPIEHHREWDRHVQKIAGGLTIMRSSKGIWRSYTGRVFEERMIPVRIACKHNEIDAIADLTIEHYNQESVMYYLVSTLVVIKDRI